MENIKDAIDRELAERKQKNGDLTKRDIDEVIEKLHYVRVPENFVVVDLDIKDENGKKNFELNKKAALAFPKTYAELSKSGQGIHLHYWWNTSLFLTTNF